MISEKKKLIEKPNLDLRVISHQLSAFIGMHGPIIFIVLSLGLLTFSVYTVNMLITKTDDPDYTAAKESESISTRFDKQTISKIEQLRGAQQNTAIKLPDGRINPFSE